MTTSQPIRCACDENDCENKIYEDQLQVGTSVAILSETTTDCFWKDRIGVSTAVLNLIY